MQQRHQIAKIAMVTLTLLLLAGCASEDMNYSQQRAISSDLDASFDHGPTPIHPSFR
jgi:hypothetical protein